jgi:hypothetical protein
MQLETSMTPAYAIKQNHVQTMAKHGLITLNSLTGLQTADLTRLCHTGLAQPLCFGGEHVGGGVPCSHT